MANGFLIGESLLTRIKTSLDRQDGQPIRLGDASIPLRLQDVGRIGSRLRVGKVSSDWAVGTCATVTVFKRVEGTCLLASTSETVEDVANLSHNVKAGSWVVIAQAADSGWYLIESGENTDDGGACRETIGGEDITKWSGWNGTRAQLLGHDASGCLKWFDVVDCSEQPLSSGGQ